MSKINNAKDLRDSRVLDLLRDDSDTFCAYQEILNAQRLGYTIRDEFKGISIENGKFRLTDFQNSSFISCDINYCNFVSSKLACTKFNHSKLTDCHFIGCDMSMVDFSDTELKEVKFIDCDLRMANFSKSQLVQSLFHSCKMSNSKFDRGTCITTLFINNSLSNMLVMGNGTIDDNVFHRCTDIPRAIENNIKMEIYTYRMDHNCLTLPNIDIRTKLNALKLKSWGLDTLF